jgi:hypothetical protein
MVYGILYCAEDGDKYLSAVVVDMETKQTLCCTSIQYVH